jgi:hypothetical protein
MLRVPQTFRYTRVVLIGVAAYALMLSVCALVVVEYIAVFRIPADAPLVRAIGVTLGLLVPVLAAKRAALYWSRITLDARGVQVQGPLRHAFLAWSDVYVLERRSTRARGLNASYALVGHTERGLQELVICDELLPDHERLLDQIRRAVPRLQYREC